MTLVLFCQDPLAPRAPDPAYKREFQAAAHAGFRTALVDFEALVQAGDATAAVQKIARVFPRQQGIYRGWMLSPERYGQMYVALAEKGVLLINDPQAYRHVHYFPDSYSAIEGRTPRSVWMPWPVDGDMDAVMVRLQPFGRSPVIVKDFVKSQKHYWREACFIPDASDRAAAERVVRRFLELQGEDLAGGLVFREFVELEELGRHPRSGMPLSREYRVFFVNGKPLCTLEYWDEGNYVGEGPPVDWAVTSARGVRSRFFTMDVARSREGTWLVVELGDGQVAGLPERADAVGFFGNLAGAMELGSGNPSTSPR